MQAFRVRLILARIPNTNLLRTLPSSLLTVNLVSLIEIPRVFTTPFPMCFAAPHPGSFCLGDTVLKVASRRLVRSKCSVPQFSHQIFWGSSSAP